MNTKYWVGLSSITTLEPEMIMGLYEKYGDIKRAFELACESDVLQLGLTKNRAQTFLKKRDSMDLDKVYEYVLERDIKILTIDDKKYPVMLKNIYNPPGILYYKGDLFSCSLDRTLAVIGSRRVSYEAKQSLKKIMSEFLNTDLCIVSGLAIGADTAAHQNALDNNLKTIGVIAGGFDNLYPASNKPLVDRIIDGNGAVIAESYPTVEPLPYRFPLRNRIVSGLSFGTLVVEAALNSGAIITANLTLEQGRELICIPGLITNPNTEGVYKLIKTGATIATCAQDVLSALGWEKNKQCSLFDSDDSQSVTDSNDIDALTIDEKKILYTIEIEPKTFDEIQNQTDLETDKLLMTLTNMELKGFIELGIGDRYTKK